MQEQINALRAALEAETSITPEIRGELAALGLMLAEKCGEPYTYGFPGSDPNVEQLADGRLRISLISAVQSGTESIEVLFMRAPKLRDGKDLKDNTVTAAIEKIKRLTTTENGRPLTSAEIDNLGEEDFLVLAGAINFLVHRFRQTGKTFRTS